MGDLEAQAKLKKSQKIDLSGAKDMKLSKFDYANSQSGCCTNLCSVFCKKLKESRRRTFITFLEVFIPILFMFLGTYFSTFEEYF